MDRSDTSNEGILFMGPDDIIIVYSCFPVVPGSPRISPRICQFCCYRFSNMAKPRTINELVQLLPDEAQHAGVYRGKTLSQLLQAGEASCLAKLTNVACASGDARAAHWSAARKIHYALVVGGLEAEKTGITPKRFTLRSASPGARAKRSRQQSDRDVADAAQGTLDSLFCRDSSEASSEEEEVASEDEGGDDAVGLNGAAAHDDDGSGKDSGSDSASASSSEEKPQRVHQVRVVKGKSPVKRQKLGRSRAASVAARESADRASKEAAWLSSIRELSTQVNGLARFMNTQGDAMVKFSDKLLLVEQQTVAAAAEAAKAPERVVEILAERAAAAKVVADKEVAAKATAEKILADKAAAEKTASKKVPVAAKTAGTEKTSSEGQTLGSVAAVPAEAVPTPTAGALGAAEATEPPTALVTSGGDPQVWLKYLGRAL